MPAGLTKLYDVFRECGVFTPNETTRPCDKAPSYLSLTPLHNHKSLIDFDSIQGPPYITNLKVEIHDEHNDHAVEVHHHHHDEPDDHKHTFLICGPMYSLVRAWACKYNLTLRYTDQFPSQESKAVAAATGDIDLMICPLPPADDYIMDCFDLSTPFHQIDSWRIIAAPVPRNRFEDQFEILRSMELSWRHLSICWGICGVLLALFKYPWLPDSRSQSLRPWTLRLLNTWLISIINVLGAGMKQYIPSFNRSRDHEKIFIAAMSIALFFLLRYLEAQFLEHLIFEPKDDCIESMEALASSPLTTYITVEKDTWFRDESDPVRRAIFSRGKRLNAEDVNDDETANQIMREISAREAALLLTEEYIKWKAREYRLSPPGFHFNVHVSGPVAASVPIFMPFARDFNTTLFDDV